MTVALQIDTQQRGRRRHPHRTVEQWIVASMDELNALPMPGCEGLQAFARRLASRVEQGGH
ncbi:hypothetical protein D3C76_1117130 [compost metagenome]